VPLVDDALLEAIDPVLADASDLAKVAEELPAVARLVKSEPRLRRALSDVFLPPETKKALIRELTGDQVGEDTYSVLDAIFDRPRLTRDVGKIVEDAALVGLLAHAHDDGSLDEVEDEIFRFARLLRGNDELRYALTDIQAPPDQKNRLIDELLEAKATSSTVALVKLVVDRRKQGDISARLFDLADLAAGRRERVVAEVRTAVEIDAKRREKLAAALAEATGRDVDVKVIIDPSVLGGVVARVGDEVLDGSVRHYLEQALFRMTR
jgi:F-type H+-transporting ATPase subunit delta